MGTLCFTVDFDRDVNTPVPGKSKAGSLCDGNPCEPRFSSSSEGLGILLDILRDLGIKATFFVEAETYVECGSPDLGKHEVALHGLGHEDFTGESTGIPISVDGAREILRTARDTVAKASGTVPKGFRAPYMKAPEYLPGLLKSEGFVYDSSYYSENGMVPVPYDLRGIVEIPASKIVDPNGKTIASYLWPMHEGKRKPSDYQAFIDSDCKGTIVLATHTWHMVETLSGGKLQPEEIEKNAEDTASVISDFIDAGYKPMTCMETALGFRNPKRQ